MGDTYRKFIVGAAQLAPVYLNREATVDKACEAIDEAAKAGAELIAFPETFIPAYPYWIYFVGSLAGMRWWRELYKNAVDVPGDATRRLCQAARRARIHVVMGISERDGGTMYNSQLFIDREGDIRGCHRKLMPTMGERIVWGRGDGSTLRLYDTDLGRIGGLICYEHINPLWRYALIAQGEQIHIAQWPTFPFESITKTLGSKMDAAVRHHAFEAGAFVISVVGHFSEEMKERLFTPEQALDVCTEGLTFEGGSMIIAPSGDLMVGPKQEEGILYAELDMERIVAAKHVVDSIGHYARPEVARLLLNRESPKVLELDEDWGDEDWDELECLEEEEEIGNIEFRSGWKDVGD